MAAVLERYLRHPSRRWRCADALNQIVWPGVRVVLSSISWFRDRTRNPWHCSTTWNLGSKVPGERWPDGFGFRKRRCSENGRLSQRRCQLTVRRAADEQRRLSRDQNRER